MKIVKIPFILLLFFSLPSFSQIMKLEFAKEESIGKIAPGGVKTMECFKIEGEETFRFDYQDQKYTRLNEWKSFEVKSNEDFETLYNYLLEGFKEIPKEPVTLMLGGNLGILQLTFEKFLGNPIVRFSHVSDNSISGYTNRYTEKQVKKLFGKE